MEEAVEVQLNAPWELHPGGQLRATETSVDKLVVVELPAQMVTSPVVVEVLLRLDSQQITQHSSLVTEVQANPFLGFPLRQQRRSALEKSVATIFTLRVGAAVDFMTLELRAAPVPEDLAAEATGRVPQMGV
jgi:aminoglycoside/choline kinase family phosphotransferase